MTETCTCCVCESNFEKEDVKHIEIKGKVKDICKGCATAIKGLV